MSLRNYFLLIQINQGQLNLHYNNYDDFVNEKKYFCKTDIPKYQKQVLLNLLYMQLHSIEQKDKTVPLPRVNHQFIGLGHELQLHRKQRRQIQLDHQTVENRVLLLQKQQEKARKDLIKKKRQLQQLIIIRERQQQHSEQKAQHLQEKMQELERLRRQNEINRMIHKNNYEGNLSMLRDRNHSDYSRIRQERIDGQYSKRMQKNNDLQQKKDNWLSLNISKQKGKARIDEFYKIKNKDHILEYQSRINIENKEKQSRINSIKNLQMREQSLRTRLENASMKNSKVEQLIKSISRTLTPMNTTEIEAELYATSRAKKSYETLNLNLTSKQKQILLQRTNSGAKEKSTYKSNSARVNNNQDKLSQYVEQNIEIGDEDNSKGGFKIIHKRRKNKHANRYKEYEAY